MKLYMMDTVKRFEQRQEVNGVVQGDISLPGLWVAAVRNGQ